MSSNPTEVTRCGPTEEYALKFAAAAMRWGLVPSWTDDKAIWQRVINARAETLRERPSYKRLVSTQRCLIPADGF
jgi:putative SOS response-associated peptidase YedK